LSVVIVKAFDSLGAVIGRQLVNISSFVLGAPLKEEMSRKSGSLA
jgi:hypothetical protein